MNKLLLGIAYASLAGTRSTLPITLLVRRLAAHGTTPADPLGPTPAFVALLNVMTAGELIVDKLPIAPSRTVPTSVVFRGLSGAAAAVLYSGKRSRSVAGRAVVGAAAAIAMTYAVMNLRKAISSRLPDPVVALAEDAIALSIGNALLSARDRA